VGLGDCYYNLRMTGNAVKNYTKSLELNPDNKKLKKWLEQLLQSEKEESQPNIDTAIQLMNLKKYDEAILELKKVLKNNSNNARVYEELGNCYYNLDKNKEALGYYKKSLEIDGNNNRLKTWLEKIEK